MAHRPFALMAVALAATLACAAEAAPARLDARARAALAALRAGTQSVSGMRARGLAVGTGGDLDVVIRGSVAPGALARAGARVRTSLPGLCTVFLPASALERVASLRGVESIRAAAPTELELSASVPTTGAPLLRGAGPLFPGLNGAGVLVGSVDTGVDYGHGDFLDASGHTRFVAIWDQTAAGAGTPAYPYGVFWSSDAIEAGLCGETDSVGHGTHVLGIAAGDGSQTGGGVAAYTHAGMAPRADLALVKTDFSTTSILDGVRYLFDLAASRGESAVVNLSLGTQYGPHDGTSDLEQGLTALAGPGRIVVKSAGNDRGTAKHAEVLATPGGATVTLSVSGSATGRGFGIDGTYDGADRVRVRVVTPSGTVVGPLPVGSESAIYPGTTTTNGDVYLANDSLGTGRKNVYLEVNALSAGQSLNGTWTFTFYADAVGPAKGEVDLWRFLASAGLGASFVTGNQPGRELISEPGNAVGVITVGSYVTRTSWTACDGVTSTFSGTPAVGSLSGFSSPGPTRDGRMKPDLAAPGEAIVSTTSFDVAPACPASPASSVLANDAMNHTAMRGTSMAAPHVTGAIALLLQKRGPLTPTEVVAYLASQAHRDASTGGSAGNDWGNGKLALGDLVDPSISITSPAPGADLSVGQTAAITWSATDSLGSVARVDVQLSRGGPDGPYETLALGVPNGGSWIWTASGPPTPPGQAYLRLVAHDGNDNAGTSTLASGLTIHDPLAVVAEPALGFALGEVRPNPAMGPLRVSFVVGRDAPVQLWVEDVQGRRVASLASGWHCAGRYEARWDPQGAAGGVAPGVYFLAYETPDGRRVRRVAVTR